MNLRQDHPALSKARTIFLKSVVSPSQATRLLQSASTNRKLGDGKRTIEKGPWAGLDMYQLLLEERATCPRSCQQWSNCYGNNMYLGKRIDHRKWAEFKGALLDEVAALSGKHPEGWVVRLHVLGDFFSTRYVQLWADAMKRHSELHIFGYTHRWPGQGDGIGEAVAAMNDPLRCHIRFSDRGGPMSANVGPSLDGSEIMCPQEQGKTKSCLTCGLCWAPGTMGKSIGFTEH